MLWCNVGQEYRCLHSYPFCYYIAQSKKKTDKYTDWQMVFWCFHVSTLIVFLFVFFVCRASATDGNEFLIPFSSVLPVFFFFFFFFSTSSSHCYIPSSSPFFIPVYLSTTFSSSSLTLILILPLHTPQHNAKIINEEDEDTKFLFGAVNSVLRGGEDSPIEMSSKKGALLHIYLLAFYVYIQFPVFFKSLPGFSSIYFLVHLLFICWLIYSIVSFMSQLQ